MKLIVNHPVIYFFINLALCIVSTSQSFVFEALQKKIQRRNNFMQNKGPSFFEKRNEHPEPLPSSTISVINLRSPYQKIYQGARRPGDVRVYRRIFDHEAQLTGHHITIEGEFHCIISHLAFETDGGIPILLRGGVGYYYFVGVVRAKAGNPLKGSVRAYCVKKQDDYYKDKVTAGPPKVLRIYEQN